MKLRSPSLTKTSRRTIACGAFHLIAPIFRWGFTKKEKNNSRWDISQKVILSTQTARTLQDVQKGQQILIQDGYLSASPNITPPLIRIGTRQMLHLCWLTFSQVPSQSFIPPGKELSHWRLARKSEFTPFTVYII